MQLSDEEMRGIKIILDLIGNSTLHGYGRRLYVDTSLFEHGICPNFITDEEYMRMLEFKFGVCYPSLCKSYVLLHISDEYLNLLLVCGHPALGRLHKGMYYACDLHRKDRNIYEFDWENTNNSCVWQERHTNEAHLVLDSVLDFFSRYFMYTGDSKSVAAYRIALEKLNALGDEFA